MFITDPSVKKHLEAGGVIALPRINWAYVRLIGNELYWIDRAGDRFICCVESYGDLTSRDWKIVNMGAPVYSLISAMNDVQASKT